jgi:hypothetical protein
MHAWWARSEVLISAEIGGCGTRTARRLLLIVAVLAAIYFHAGCAMRVKVVGDQLILSGPVVDGDLGTIQQTLASSPMITTVILRDSRAGMSRPDIRWGSGFGRKAYALLSQASAIRLAHACFLVAPREYLLTMHQPRTPTWGFMDTTIEVAGSCRTLLNG